MKYSLAFKDENLETQFQSNRNILKPINFHKYLILEFLLASSIVIINYTTGVLTSFIIAISMLSAFFSVIFLIIIFIPKITHYKHTIHIFALIHIISLYAFVCYLHTLRVNDICDYYLLTMIFSASSHLCFISILISRIKWYWSSFWDFIYHILFIFLVFPLTEIVDKPFIIVIHFICFISFVMLSFDQEKSLREIYKIISDSNEHLNEFKMLLKNVIPFPTMILDFDQKNIEFINNSAMNLIKNEIFDTSVNESPSHFSQEEIKQMLFHTSKVIKKRLMFDDIESFLNKCELIPTNPLDIPINSFSEIRSLLSKDKKIFKLYQDQLDFHQIAVHSKNSKNTHQQDGFSDRNFTIKFLKIIWEKKQSVLIIINDVTDLNKLKELQTLDNYKNQLLATVSHDLRTPLNGMVGLIEIVLLNVKEKQDKKNLNLALRSGHLLAHMINDILDFSQINNQKLRLIKEKFDLMGTIKETLKLIKFQIQAKGLQLIFESRVSKAIIFSDCCRIKQILLNLLTNALKFTLKGSIKVSVEIMQNLYKVQIEDTGIGIKSEDIPKLFHLFSKLDCNENNKTGIGLGLTISNNLAKLLNPEDPQGIYVESQIGIGSKFWFYLKDDDDVQQSLQINSAPNMKKMINSSKEDFNSLKEKRILIVDDDLMNIMVAELYCKHYKIGFKSVSNGIDAVEYIEKEVIENNNRLDFILMDCNMPIMNGFQATFEIIEKLKKSNKSAIPVVGMTANVLQEDLDKCLNVGMKCYLIKPVDRQEFGKCLKRVLS